MPTSPERPLEVTVEQFRKDRGAVYEVASTGRTVIILGEDQQPKTIIAMRREKLPMRFD